MSGSQTNPDPEKPAFWAWVRWGGLILLIATVGLKNVTVVSWISGRGAEAEVRCGGGSIGCLYQFAKPPPGTPVHRPEFHLGHYRQRPNEGNGQWLVWRFEHQKGTGDWLGDNRWSIKIGCLFVVAAYLIVCIMAGSAANPAC